MAENKKELQFELGKYYKHTTGDKIYICGVCAPIYYNKCLMAESRDGVFIPVGNHEGATLNWHEISKEEFLADD